MDSRLSPATVYREITREHREHIGREKPTGLHIHRASRCRAARRWEAGKVATKPNSPSATEPCGSTQAHSTWWIGASPDQVFRVPDQTFRFIPGPEDTIFRVTTRQEENAGPAHAGQLTPRPRESISFRQSDSLLPFSETCDRKDQSNQHSRRRKAMSEDLRSNPSAPAMKQSRAACAALLRGTLHGWP